MCDIGSHEKARAPRSCRVARMGSGTSSLSSLRAVAGSLDDTARAEIIECLSQSQTGPGRSTAEEAVPRCSQAQEAPKVTQVRPTNSTPRACASTMPTAFQTLAAEQDALSALLVQLHGVEQRLHIMQAAIRGAAAEAQELSPHLGDGLTLSGRLGAYGGGPAVAVAEIAAMNARVEDLLRARDALLVRVATCAEARDRARAQVAMAAPGRAFATHGLDVDRDWCCRNAYHSPMGAAPCQIPASGFECDTSLGSGHYGYGCVASNVLELETELVRHQQLLREVLAEDAIYARELQNIVRRSRHEPRPGCQPTEAWLHAHDWS